MSFEDRKSRIENRRGITLLELMVVMGIISIVLGSSSAFFTQMRKAYRLQAEVSQTKSVIRAGRLGAIGSGGPTRVLFAERLVRAVGMRTVGHWRFDDMTGRGALGRNASIGGAELRPGIVGNALLFPGKGETVDCGPASAYRIERGMAFEAWVQPWATRNQNLFVAGDRIVIGVTEEAALRAAIGGRSVAGPPGLVVANRWTRILVTWDGSEIALHSGGVLRARAPGPPPLEFEPSDRVTVSSRGTSWFGLVDEVKLMTVTTISSHELPEWMRFVRRPAALHFTPQGKLSPLHHTAGELVSIHSSNRRETRSFVVDLVGLFEDLEPVRDAKPEEKKKKEEEEEEEEEKKKKKDL